jgi:arabinogalactan oligomer/maltooligosaccharide transport system substrate-binding protein
LNFNYLKEKRMKKSLFLLFSLMIVFSIVLTACGGAANEAPAAPVEEQPAAQAPAEEQAEEAAPAEMTPVTLAFWEQEGDEVDVFIDELIAEFEAAYPYITVERTHYENEALRDQFQTASLAEAAPEVVRVPNDFAGPFSQLQIVAPISALFDDAFLAQFFDGALGPAVVGGTLWGVPDNYGNHLMLLYNKSLIAEAPATFEDLIDQAKALTSGDVQGFAYNLNEPFWGAGFYGAFGGWPLDENDAPTFDNQAFIDYLTFVYSLKTDGVVPSECDYNCADTLFKEGNAAMIINGDWSLGDYTTALGDNLGTAPVPPINGGTYTEMTAGKYFMVSNAVLDDPDKQAAVVAFITFMTSPDVQARWLSDFSRLPSNKEIAADPSIADDPVLAGSMAALANGRGMPAAAQMRCAWDAWRPNLEGVMAGTLAPADAAAAAQQSADDCVATLQ